MRTWMLCMAMLAAGCGAKDEPPPPAVVAADPFPMALRLEKAPEGAVEVGALKKSAKEGQEVVLRARVGGADDPFIAGRAVMTVADMKAIMSCADMDMGEEGCKTPWDYCCTPREELLANTATIRVAGPDGQPLKAGLRSWKGIEPLKVVVIRGIVGPRPDPAVLVVDAQGIFVE
jgi:hypothetical protein